MKQDLTWRIAGPAGLGIKAAGAVFSRSVAREGLSVVDHTEYPSLIRGGHNVFTARVSDADVKAASREVDLLVALDREAVDRHLGALRRGAAIIHDPAAFPIDEDTIATSLGRPNVRLCAVPMVELATARGGPKLMANTVAVGATLGILGLPLERLEGVLEEQFRRKGDRVVSMNVQAARDGWDATHGACSDFAHQLAGVPGAAPRLVVDGNEAVGFGALAAGCRFYAAYPMTPASPLLHFMASVEESHGVVVKHTEDEIAAINMAIGAATAGSRAMCATSGGGFSLMVEGLGLAGVTETPIVVGVFSRPGPATGMPTWTEQGDLRFVIHAAQGEFPRIVLVPGDKEECFALSAEAFNLAEEYQTPVIILSDMIMQESHETVEPFDWRSIAIRRGKLLDQAAVDGLPRTGDGLADHRFYALGDAHGEFADGVSWRTLPGTRGVVGIRNSYEHDERGWATEDAAMRIAQNAKRMRKLTAARARVPEPRFYGPPRADATIISYGSPKGAILEAMDLLADDGVTANFLQVRTVWPFPKRGVSDALDRAARTLVVEGGLTGQFESLICQTCLTEVDDRLRKYDGRQFYADEIAAKVRDVVSRG